MVRQPISLEELKGDPEALQHEKKKILNSFSRPGRMSIFHTLLSRFRGIIIIGFPELFMNFVDKL